MNQPRPPIDDTATALRRARVLRYATGVTLAIVVAYTLQWSLSFLVPVLSAVFLAMPLPRPPFRSGLRNMLFTLSAFMIGAFYALFLLPFPLIYVPMLGLVLFRIYYLLNRGGPFWFCLMALLAVLILPMLGNTHEGLSVAFAIGFITSGWVTVIIVWIAHMLVPDPPLPAGGRTRPGFQPGYSPAAASAALKSTLVVLPMAILFLSFNWTGQLVILIFSAIFTISPEAGKGIQAGMNSVRSTLIGGLSAAVIYWMLVAVPVFYFFVPLMFLTALLFARIIFSDSAAAPYCSSAFVALFVLVNSSLGANSDFASAFALRVVFITSATLYVVVALTVLQRFDRSRRTAVSGAADRPATNSG